MLKPLESPNYGFEPEFDAIAILQEVYDAGDPATGKVIRFPIQFVDRTNTFAELADNIAPRDKSMEDTAAASDAEGKAAAAPDEASSDDLDAFEIAVNQAREEGVLVSRIKCATTAMKDTRLGHRHLCVLAYLLEAQNSTTAVCYPGVDRLVAEIRYYADGWKAYTRAVIKGTISDLMKFGYIVSKKKAPAPHRRAIAHYVSTRPADLVVEIEAWVAKKRAGKSVPEVNTSPNLRQSTNSTTEVNTTLNHSNPEVNTVVVAEVNTGVTRAVKEPRKEPDIGAALPLPLGELNEEKASRDAAPTGSPKPPKAEKPRKNRLDLSAAASAVELWNETAKRCGFVSQTLALVHQRAAQLAQQIANVGGLDVFRAALDLFAQDEFWRAQGNRVNLNRFVYGNMHSGETQLRKFANLALQRCAAPTTSPPPLLTAKDLRVPAVQRSLGIDGMLRVIAQRKAENAGLWPEAHLGPPPGAPGCFFPADVIAALKDRTHADR